MRFINYYKNFPSFQTTAENNFRRLQESADINTFADLKDETYKLFPSLDRDSGISLFKDKKGEYTEKNSYCLHMPSFGYVPCNTSDEFIYNINSFIMTYKHINNLFKYGGSVLLNNDHTVTKLFPELKKEIFLLSDDYIKKHKDNIDNYENTIFGEYNLYFKSDNKNIFIPLNNKAASLVINIDVALDKYPQLKNKSKTIGKRFNNNDEHISSIMKKKRSR